MFWLQQDHSSSTTARSNSIINSFWPCCKSWSRIYIFIVTKLSPTVFAKYYSNLFAVKQSYSWIAQPSHASTSSEKEFVLLWNSFCEQKLNRIREIFRQENFITQSIWNVYFVFYYFILFWVFTRIYFEACELKRLNI